MAAARLEGIVSFSNELGNDEEERRLPCTTCVLAQSCHFHLNSVNTIDTVRKENENEDEGDLQPILQFGYYRTFGNEVEEFAFHGEGHGDDEADENGHLGHKEGEHLTIMIRKALITSVAAGVGAAVIELLTRL